MLNTTPSIVKVHIDAMDEVQTQPDSGLPREVPGKDSLVTQLDHLLERYLNTLDQYQNAQQQLTAYMSSVRSKWEFLPTSADLR
jgi:hypothetical protein